MQIVDKIVELFRKHTGKTLVDVRGFTTAIVMAGQVDKPVTFTFDFKDDDTGEIEPLVIEATARLEDAGAPNGIPDFEAADLRIVSVRNYPAPKPAKTDPAVDEERRLRSIAMTGYEPGHQWTPEPPSAKDMADMEQLRRTLAGDDEPGAKPGQPPEPEQEK